MKRNIYAPLDVVIVTKQRYAQLAECIQCLCTNSMKPARLIVIDNSSTFDGGSIDKIKHICTRARIPLLYKKTVSKGIGYVRNVGLRYVHARYFAFIDDDEYAPKNWIASIEAFFTCHPTIHILTGPKIPRHQENYWNQVWDALQKNSYMYEGENQTPIGGNCAFQTKFIKHNRLLFDERFIRSGEDWAYLFLLLQHHAHIYCTPTMQVFHDCRTSITSFVKQWFEYGEGVHQYTALYHSLPKYPQTNKSLCASFPFPMSLENIAVWPGAILMHLSYLCGYLDLFFRKTYVVN